MLTALPAVMLMLCVILPAAGQYYTPQLVPPAPQAPPPVPDNDSVPLPMPIMPSIPYSYEDLMRNELAYDLATPSNIKTEAEYDPATGNYIVHTRLGEIGRAHV